MRWLILILAVVLFATFSSILLPGVYMDGVNPDYMVARFLSESPENIPVWTPPGTLLFNRFPLIGNIYHGTLPFWLGLPFYSVFGTDVVGIRLTHAAFAFMLLASAWWMLREMGVQAWLSAGALTAMAIDPAFHFIFRSAFYMLAVPLIFFFASIALLWRPVYCHSANARWILFLSGLAAGIAAYGYFIYVFFTFTLGLFVLLSRDRRLIVPWVLGAAIGFSPMMIGLLLYANAVGGLSALNAASAISAEPVGHDFFQRASNIWAMWKLVYDGQAFAVMILGEAMNMRMSLYRFLWLLAVPSTAMVALLVFKRPQKELFFFFIMLFVPPILFGLTFGLRLWAHHYTAIVPMMYCFAVVSWSYLIRNRSWSIASIVVAMSVLVLFVVNANNFQMFVHRLKSGGGVVLFSDATNRFAWRMQHEDAVAIVPDWGLFMPLAMITRGDTRILTSFSPEIVKSLLCEGKSVVVTSTSNKPEAALKLSQERAASVTWPNRRMDQIDTLAGKPAIYLTRWDAMEDGACP